jgi:hypothetical protein
LADPAAWLAMTLRFENVTSASAPLSRSRVTLGLSPAGFIR